MGGNSMKKTIIFSLALVLTAAFAVSYAGAQTFNDLKAVNDWVASITNAPKGVFAVIFQEGSPLAGPSTAAIIKDRETGCHYIFIKEGQSAVLTPRINSRGGYVCD